MKYLTNILKTLMFKNTPFISIGGSFVFWLFLMALGVSTAQEIDPQLSESNGYVFEGNSIVEDDFIGAEKKYRLAVSTKKNNAIGSFNLGNAYFNSKLYDEALLRHLEAAQNSTSKPEKHKVYHNIGTILMQKKQCKEAVSAFKNALRNNPADDESRYNLALAQECAKEQGGGDGDGEDEDKDKDKDENKDDKKDSDEKQDKDDKNKDEGNKDDKNEGEDKEDEDGKPKDDKGDQKNNDPKDDKGKPQQQPGKLSPQQVKNLLEAMNNEEKKVQEKMNASKTKGIKVKTEKDW